MTELTVPLRCLAHARGLSLPAYATAGSAGLDLIAALAEAVAIPPGEWRLIPTGLTIELPPRFEAQIRARSGMALRSGVTVLNSPGTIDSDYRGEIGVILINHGAEPFTVSRGDRVAQLVVAPIARVRWSEAVPPQTSLRAAGGFGSTG